MTGNTRMTPNIQRFSKVLIDVTVGGSDARTIMGDDQAALVRLWREKRGEVDR